jgi:hypothetical protein
MSKPSPVLTIDNWTTSEIKYLAPKVNDKGGKSINVISKQTNRALNISTPLMMTWGISDYVDEKTGESDGKYTISLQFPRDDERTSSTDAFLTKLKDFENQILDDAVKNSEAWFGDDSLSREVIKHMFFPTLKYSKNKDTKKVDYSRPPSIRAKVPNYGGKWSIEIYDTQSNLIFPCEHPDMSPMDFVPKLSSVACVLSFSQIWIGGKGFGIMLKLVQWVVKLKLIESVFGKCHIQLSMDEMKTMDSQKVPDKVTMSVCVDEEEEVTKVAASTEVEDSDEEVDEDVVETAAPVPVPAVAVVQAAVETVVEEVPTPPLSHETVGVEPVKKKVIRKKV